MEENYGIEKRVRPTFLTVLCILTFIGSGWFLFTNSVAFSNPQAQVDAITTASEEAKNKPGQSEMGKNMMESLKAAYTFDNVRNNSLAQIISSVLCILGALLMFMLRRIGYYIYILATIIGIGASIYIFGTGNIVALGISMFFGFFGLLFIVLYGLNLKSMR